MSTLNQHRPFLRQPPIEYRPELRWWLAEGLHTDTTLRFEIESAHRLGFGGMEFLAEIRPATAITTLTAGVSALRPWTELSGVGPAVSGVASYRAEFTLRQEAELGERLLLELGPTCGGLGSVVVNDSEPRGFDTSWPVVDITTTAKAGRNDVIVRVASSLNNRLIARGYYDQVQDIGALLLGRTGVHATTIRPHGLVGPPA
jgi:hypothetical protein